MNKVYGISLSLSSYEDGIWFDHDEKEYQEKGWGIRLAIIAGKMIRPVPKMYKLTWWKELSKGKDNSLNPWQGAEPWFVIRIPLFVFPFISIALGKIGFYLGCKTFDIEEKHHTPERYGKWIKEDEYGKFLQISASTRSTRWK